MRHHGNCDVVPQDLQGELGLEVSLRTVERAVAHLRREVLAQSSATICFETPLGHQLQIDFGTVRVQIGGEVQKVHLFVVTLGYSRRTDMAASCTSASPLGCTAWKAPSGTSAGSPASSCYTTPRRWWTTTTRRPARCALTSGSTASAATGTWRRAPVRPARGRTKGKSPAGGGGQPPGATTIINDTRVPLQGMCIM